MKNLLILILLFFVLDAISVENRKKIGIIDTGVSKEQANSIYMCEDGIKKVITNDDGIDEIGHGSNVFGLIKEQVNPKTHCIVSYKFMNKKHIFENSSLDYYFYALDLARQDNLSYLNMSIQGDKGFSYERQVIEELVGKNVKVVVSAGNSSRDLDKNCTTFPACYKQTITNENLIVVGSTDKSYSNFGKIVKYYINGTNKGFPSMSGTSQSAAIITSFLVK